MTPQELKLKEYIKEIIRTELDEESGTGAIGVGAGPIQTPYAFAPKGQKKNKATKTSEKLGFKVAKGMPKHSKILDYKQLWPGKKSAMNEDFEASATNLDIEQLADRLLQGRESITPTDLVAELPGLKSANFYKLILTIANRGKLKTFSGVKIPPAAIDKFIDDKGKIATQTLSTAATLNEEKVEIDVPEEVEKDMDAHGFMSLNDLFKQEKRADREKLSYDTKTWIQQTFLPHIKSMKESWYDQASQYGAASGYTGVGGDDRPNVYYGNTRLKESIEDIIKQELLNEASYGQFKKEVSYRTKSEMLHKGIKNVKKKIQEINRIVEYTSRMKQELSEGDGVQYWNRTEAQLQQISEMVNNLNEKIKNLK
jgi:hypothetical protein